MVHYGGPCFGRRHAVTKDGKQSFQKMRAPAELGYDGKKPFNSSRACELNRLEIHREGRHLMPRFAIVELNSSTRGSAVDVIQKSIFRREWEDIRTLLRLTNVERQHEVLIRVD